MSSELNFADFKAEAVAARPEEIRVAVLFQRFGPYHHARLNAAGRLFPLWGLETCAEEDTYAWDKVEGAESFHRVTLTERHVGDQRWKQELHRKMWQALDTVKPKVVVVPGWASADAFSALSWCAAHDTAAVMMSESTAWDERRASWKEWVKGRIVKLCRAGFAGGTPHAAYLAQLGMPRDRIFLGYDSVDNEYFYRRANEVRAAAAAIRQSRRLPLKFFLACARFVEKKNLFGLLHSFARYRQEAKAAGRTEIWDLVLLGDGVLRPALVDLGTRLGLNSHLHLPGFKQYDELPEYFGLAQAFVHASTTEQWGLVVNEAMASALPVLVSNRCGCAPDLVCEDLNGFTFSPEDPDAVGRLMFRVSAVDFPLGRFGAESWRLIGKWGPDRFADGLRGAVTSALQSSARPAGIFDRLLLNLLLCR